jgi:hypothetical protein
MMNFELTDLRLKNSKIERWKDGGIDKWKDLEI